METFSQSGAEYSTAPVGFLKDAPKLFHLGGNFLEPKATGYSDCDEDITESTRSPNVWKEAINHWVHFPLSAPSHSQTHNHVHAHKIHALGSFQNWEASLNT